MLFRSDNVTAVCDEVIAPFLAENQGDAAPYGADDTTARLDAVFGEYFETSVSVHPVATGIAARAIAQPPVRSRTATRLSIAISPSVFSSWF